MNTAIEAADRRIARKLAEAAAARLGPWTEAEVTAYEEAVVNAPAAHYVGKRMYPVDVHALGLEAVERVKGGAR